MNSEHMREIRAFIAALPMNACDMGTWGKITKLGGWTYITFDRMAEQGFECGSAACLGGWTAMYVTHKTHHERTADVDAFDWRETSTIAAKFLELNSRDAHYLFLHFPDEKPEEGWKEWMLRRLDETIQLGYVPIWDEDGDDCQYDAWHEDEAIADPRPA